MQCGLFPNFLESSGVSHLARKCPPSDIPERRANDTAEPTGARARHQGLSGTTLLQCHVTTAVPEPMALRRGVIGGLSRFFLECPFSTSTSPRARAPFTNSGVEGNGHGVRRSSAPPSDWSSFSTSMVWVSLRASAPVEQQCGGARGPALRTLIGAEGSRTLKKWSFQLRTSDKKR